MEKIRKPTTNVFRLFFLLIGLITLILSPICLYSYFYYYGVPKLNHTQQGVTVQTNYLEDNVTFVDNLDYEDPTSIISDLSHRNSIDSNNGAPPGQSGNGM